MARSGKRWLGGEGCNGKAVRVAAQCSAVRCGLYALRAAWHQVDVNCALSNHLSRSSGVCGQLPMIRSGRIRVKFIPSSCLHGDGSSSGQTKPPCSSSSSKNWFKVGSRTASQWRRTAAWAGRARGGGGLAEGEKEMEKGARRGKAGCTQVRCSRAWQGGKPRAAEAAQQQALASGAVGGAQGGA